MASDVIITAVGVENREVSAFLLYVSVQKIVLYQIRNVSIELFGLPPAYPFAIFSRPFP
jgi:hypothetical protein